MSESTKKDEFWRSLPFAALIGDVRGSRELEDRAAFQADLEARLDALSRELGPSALVCPLALTAGDELQGLFHDYGAVLKVVVALADALHPVRIAYGLGFGELSVPPGPRVALLDGPCFHRAREALEVAQRRDGWLRSSGLGETEDDLLGAHLDLIDGLRRNWTAKQAHYARERLHHNQKDIAAAAEVSPSVVSESLKAAQAKRVRTAEGAVEAWLEDFCFLREYGVATLVQPHFPADATP